MFNKNSLKRFIGSSFAAMVLFPLSGNTKVVPLNRNAEEGAELNKPQQPTVLQARDYIARKVFATAKNLDSDALIEVSNQRYKIVFSQDVPLDNMLDTFMRAAEVAEKKVNLGVAHGEFSVYGLSSSAKQRLSSLEGVQLRDGGETLTLVLADVVRVMPQIKHIAQDSSATIPHNTLASVWIPQLRGKSVVQRGGGC